MASEETTHGPHVLHTVLIAPFQRDAFLREERTFLDSAEGTLHMSAAALA